MQKLKEFFAPPDPKELVRKWQATLRAEKRALERQIRGEGARGRSRYCRASAGPTQPSSAPLAAVVLRADIQNEEKKIKKSIKDAAKRGDMGSAKVRARDGAARGMSMRPRA